MSVTIDGLSYNYRKPMSNVGKRPSSALTDYTFPIRITADTDIGGRCLSTGNDLRFTLADDTLLYADKDYFSVAGGAATGLFWVKVPSVPSASDIALRCYYGNAGAGAQGSPTNAYDSYHHGVWHLGEAIGTIYDATSNGNNLAVHGSPSYGQTGMIDSCIRGTGNQYWDKAHAASQYVGASQTHEAWIKLDSYANGVIVQKRGYSNPAAGYCYGFWLGGTGYKRLFYQFYTATYRAAESTRDLPLNIWKHVAAVISGGYCTLYIDGVAETAINVAENPPNIGTEPLHLGGYPLGVGYPFPGYLDEVRLQATARSAGYIAYDYTTQSAEFLTWGAEEAAGAVIIPRRVSVPIRLGPRLFPTGG